MSNSEVTVSSGGRQVHPGSQQLHFNQDATVTYGENNLASSYDNHKNEPEEDFPRYTTKELRDHFERTIEEAAPHKPMKTGLDINRSKWFSNVTQKAMISEVFEPSAKEQKEDTITAMTDYEDFPPPPFEDSDYLPPPPPDLLQMSTDNEHIPACYSPEPSEPANISKLPIDKEAYVKQRHMNELKRLYKHIHPDVRKNIEKESYDHYDATDSSQLESQEYIYDDDIIGPNDIIMSPDQEYDEWDEVIQGEVQARRWMFENTPLDAIKDETPDEEGANKKITQQEIILGKDVRHTAWMFETKPMDELGSHNASSTEYKNKFNKLDTGDVRAAAWLFETQTMDSLNKMHMEEDLTKEIVFTEEDGNATIYMIDNKYMESLGDTETVDESHLLSLRSVLEEINGDVKTVTTTFDTQFKCVLMGQSIQMLEIKSVRKIEAELENSIASRWLFDTQPLDMTNRDPTSLKLVCSISMEDSNKGDWGRWLFEIKTLNSVSQWESSKLDKKEIIRADVRKHCLVFETQPMDSLKDDSNARPQSTEEIIGGNVKSARNFFENSPQLARKIGPDVGKLKKAEENERIKGDVRHQKWRFESQPLEHIREEKKEVIRTVNVEDDLTQEDGTSCRADVRRNCWVFETQPMDSLKDNSNARPSTKEEIIAGNVRSTRHYFESVPVEELKELAEVGKLKKTVALDEEKGDVRHQKWRFESQPLEEIREEKKEVIRTIDQEEIEKVDVSNYKQIFEASELNRRDESQKIVIEGVTSGSVMSNKNMFESTPLYAMQDSLGHFHEVKTVRREEVVKGDVTTCKWMFETRPVDQFDESIDKYQIIKGISKQEIESGDVKTAKWLFETQPLDAIKYFSNIEDDEIVEKSKNLDVVKGDVKTCKWLFETQPMDVLYERVEVQDKHDMEEITKGDVKTCTWLFETQSLDTIQEETVLKTRTVNQEDVRGKDVRTACFLFETEKLGNLTGEETGSFKRVTEIDITSGDVSRMKYIFENQTSDIMTSTSEEIMHTLKKVQSEDIQKGNVVNCKWLFENQNIDAIHDRQEQIVINRTVNDVQGGDVENRRFIFETFSLDKIQVSPETDPKEVQKIIREEDEKGDVQNYTMMFETQPLYAIQDKHGHYHEVTTVTSEEVTRGDVIGTRWLFETKPLDAIKDTDEVYIIKSVTQEDVQKGDVTAAKWKFETQPLDRIAEEKKALMKTVDDIQGGNVKQNKHRFESDFSVQESVRTVNVSEIQKGDVRTAKWRFETQPIDKIRSMSSENLIERVKKEEVSKGDVKHSVWLFEKNPLDHIKEVDESEDAIITQEEIPKADVKSTTWLFETTPFDNFNETKMEKTEILGKSIKGTLEELYTQKMVTSKGILIEADEIGDVRMAKYQLMNKQAPEIQREEVIKGDLQTIMMNLLNREEAMERQIVIGSAEKGNISSTVHQLFNQHRDSSVKREEILRGDIQEAISNLFNAGGMVTHGILIQEDEKGDVQMTIYSLLNKQEDVTVEKEDIIKGDIKSALQQLSSHDKPDQTAKIRVDDAEKGHVNFYSTCIESGALEYLKQLHSEHEEAPPSTAEKEKVIGGDIKGTKIILGHSQPHIERTVEDVIPGDVHNTVKVFMSEPVVSLERVQKEEIVKGDLRAALISLSESVNQTVVVEKEEVVKGNIPKALRCLERAQKQHKEVEKPDIIPGNIKGALRSLTKSPTTRPEAVIEDLVPGDVKATIKSLELAKQTMREVEKEEIVPGDIHTAMQCLQDASSERRKCQQEIDVQGDVKGTIQLLLDPPPSPQMQRRATLEGDVKMSIKSLYGTQEQTQLEKEEVIKGDVKGTIKSLLETAQRESPTSAACKRVRVKQSPPVKNLKADAKRNVQKIKTANLVETPRENTCISRERTKSVEQSARQSKTVVEHKTITQHHGIKTLKTEFRNLKATPKGMIRLDKTKVRTDVYFPKPQALEPDLSLSLPLPPTGDTDLPLPPPPPPPPADAEAEHILPPPPLPLTCEQDLLPPPPSQQELDSMPLQVAKTTVIKAKVPTSHPVPKLEPKVQISAAKQVDVPSETVSTSKTSVVEISQIQSTHTSKPFEMPLLTESPRSLKKVYISPVRFTPPPSPPPFMRGKTSRFNTPLIQAEEKYRKLREENTPPTTPTPTYMHDSLTSALEMLSTKDSEQSNKSTSNVSVGRAEKTVLNDLSDSLSCHLSKRAVISDITQSDGLEKIPTDSMILLSAKDQIVSIESTKSASVQKTLMISTVQKTEMPANFFTDKAQGSITDIKTENRTSHQKDSKNQKPKAFTKPDGRKEDKTCILPEQIPVQIVKHEIVTPAENVASHTSKSEKKKDNTSSEFLTNLCSQSTKKENITTDENGMASKSLQLDNKKKGDDCLFKNKEMGSDESTEMEKVTPSVKPNQKVKKTSKKEMQVETQIVGETAKSSVSKEFKVEMKNMSEAKVISECEEAKVEVNQEIKTVSPSPVDAAVSITDKQPDTPVPPKRKKKSKKSKGGAQGKDFSIESKTDMTETKAAMCEKTHQTPKTNATSQIHKSVNEDHICVEKEITERKENQNFQQQMPLQKKVKDAEKKIEKQQNTGEATKKCEDALVMVAGGSGHNKIIKSSSDKRGDSQTEVKILISHNTKVEKVSGNLTDSHQSSSQGPESISQVRPKGLQSNETTEKYEGEHTYENIPLGGMVTRISKISSSCTKTESYQMPKSSMESKKEEVSQLKFPDFRTPSPSLRMRSPSPTFITIESIKRTASPQRVTPSPTSLYRPLTPPTPPPRRCDTPSCITRITPSPTFDRAENLARLKDTTAKLSRVVTPPPLLSPQQIPEMKSEIVESPPSFHRQIKIEPQAVGFSGVPSEKSKKSLPEVVQQAKPKDPNDFQSKSLAESHSSLHQTSPNLDGSDITELSILCASVREKKQFFEGAQKAEINKVYVRKDPIDIPKQLSFDAEELCFEKNKKKEKDQPPRADLCGLVNKFELPEEKIYIRKELIPLAELLQNETESTDDDKENADILEQEMPTFDIQAIKNVFEVGEQSYAFKEEKRNQVESLLIQSETAADTSKQKSPKETKQCSRQSTPIPPQKDVTKSVPAEPSANSQTKSITQQFSNVDEFGNKVTGTRTAVSGHMVAPFSYADAVKSKAAAVKRTEKYDEDSTEKLLRNFHKTWTESEMVFKSFGYSVSEETKTGVSSDSSSEIGAVCSMSEEGVSDGCSDSGQKKVP
ncbi:xin actin-binding repeat-containing protein 2 isoform X2 [Thalassophryne amazonica]|nr:xin actin-binding repeat-containing protein 2 isoform X2 [Thalassophryne amazonica]